MRIVITFIFSVMSVMSFSQKTYYVSPFSSGTQDGSSWANSSYFYLALDAALPGDTIWVRWGTYIPSGFLRELSFNLKNGVKIYGGFAGTENSLTQRDLNSPLQSVLSGDIGLALNHSDNSYHVLTATDCDSTTLLDGFVIASGNANGVDINQDKGGGILIVSNDPNILYGPIIKNCTFSHCQATFGGGIGIASTTGFIPGVQILATSFDTNISQFGGGGIYSEGGVNQDAVVSLKDCYFYSNRSKFGLGGAVNFENSFGKFQFEKCRFFRDSTKDGFEGGGVFMGLNQFNSDISFIACKFEECFAAVGGGIYIRDNDTAIKTHDITLQNTIFLKNSTLNEGGGMAMFGGPNTTENILLDSVIFDGNFADADAAGINIGNSGQAILNLEIKNSQFSNNNGGTPGAGAIRIFHFTGVNTKSNVLIHNCLFNNNTGAYSITVPPPPYKASCYTHILNSTFVNNSRYVFNKNWSPDFDYVNSYNFMDIYNCVIIDTTALKRMFYNNSFNPFTMHDYRVNHCLISKPDCIFEGQSICGDQMLYDLDPDFEDNTFIPKSCSPLVNAGNNFWPDTFNIATDLLGSNRIIFDTVDIGAYEVMQACISDASFQPKTEGYPLYKMLKNPVTEHEPLIFVAEQAVYSEVSVQVFDFMGRLLQHKPYPIGANQVLSMSTDLRSGAYLAVIGIGNKKYALRFVVTGQ